MTDIHIRLASQAITTCLSGQTEGGDGTYKRYDMGSMETCRMHRPTSPTHIFSNSSVSIESDIPIHDRESMIVRYVYDQSQYRTYTTWVNKSFESV